MLRSADFVKPLAMPRVDLPRLSDKELARFSLVRAIGACRSGKWQQHAPLEREYSDAAEKVLGEATRWGQHSLYVPPEIMQDIQVHGRGDYVPPGYMQRDLQTTVATGGGYLVGGGVMGALDYLRPLMRVGRLGATFMDNLPKGFVEFVRQGATVTVTWHPTETTQGVETTDFAFGQFVMTPKTATANVDVTYALMKLAPALAESTLRRDMKLGLATDLDAKAIAGTGAGGAPQGLLNTTGIGTFTGASLAYSGLLEAQADVLTANALFNDIGFLCRPTVAQLLANRQGFSTLVPMWEGPLAAGLLAKCPAYSTMNVPAATLIGGDFSQLILAQWGGIEIGVDPYSNFQQAVTKFAAFMSVDVAVAWPQAFSVATSVS